MAASQCGLSEMVALLIHYEAALEMKDWVSIEMFGLRQNHHFLTTHFPTLCRLAALP